MTGLFATRRHILQWQGILYEFKQMDHSGNTLEQWEERFRKEIEFEKRETSLF